MGVCQGKPHRQIQRNVKFSKSPDNTGSIRLSISISEAQNRAELRNYYGTLIEKEKAKYAPELTLSSSKLYNSRQQCMPKPRSTPGLQCPNSN